VRLGTDIFLLYIYTFYSNDYEIKMEKLDIIILRFLEQVSLTVGCWTFFLVLLGILTSLDQFWQTKLTFSIRKDANVRNWRIFTTTNVDDRYKKLIIAAY